jgi:transcription elongation factor Elf1
MAATTKPCKVCGSETKVTTLDAFRGEEGPVAVMVEGMPALVCANGHKRFVHPEFVARLMDAVAEPEQIAPQPPATKRGLLKKRYHCHRCDAELPAAPTGKSERRLDMNLKNAGAFKVAVQVAVHQCAGCGGEQVLSNDEIGSCALKAMAHGFRAADVHVDR